MKKLILIFVTIFSTVLTFSQTGPGGVGNSSNNVLWLDANSFEYSTSPYISDWYDQSGNFNDFSQPTFAKQPSFVSYTGFNAIRFRSDYFLNAGIAALNTNTVTKYLVFEGGQANHYGVIMDAAYTQSTQFLRTYRNGANIRTWTLTSTGAIKDNTTPISAGFQIMSSVWDGGAQTFTSYKDGTSFGSKAGADGNPTGNYSNSIGAAINGGNGLQGDVAEIIVYTSVLNTAERNIVDNYLSSTYGITISNDLYSYDATNKYQVIGIGQEADGNNLTAQGKGYVQLSVGALSNGEYILSGHNNTDINTTTNDVPAAIAGGSRLNRTWRVDITGATNTVDVVFDINSFPLDIGNYYLLVESNNGIFNDGDAVAYGPFVEDGGGLVTIAGVPFADGDYFTIASGSNAGITSATSGYWDVASTWTCSCVPTLTDDVTINGGHTVTARTSLDEVNNITVSGTLNTLQTSVFNVYGDYLIKPTGNALHKLVTFMGSTAQTINNQSTNSIDFSTLVINNSNNVSLTSGKFELSNSIKITAGQLKNIGATFTFNSTASRSAVILNSSGNGFSGEYIVKRYISSRNASWGDLSSPVNRNHLRDWDSNPAGTARELFMCGVSGFSGNCGGWNSVYSFDKTIQDYVAVTDTGFVLNQGIGIELWLEDTNSLFYNTTFDSRGTPNYGSIVVPVANSWNLVGNPYQAFINWTGLTKPTLNSTYYIWNTNNASYDAKTSGQIPPHQGFWVESVGSGNLTFKEASKNNVGFSTFYKTAQQGVDVLDEDSEPVTFSEAILKVKNITLKYSHELKLRINELATVSLDEFDASFLPSRIAEAPSITAFGENSNKPLAIVSFNQNHEVTVPLSIKTGVSGNIVIEAINFDEFNALYRNVLLFDTKTNTTYNLKTQKEVTVDLAMDEDDARFELRLSNNIGSISANALEVTIYKNQTNTIIEMNGDISEGYTVSIVNVLGQKVVEDYVNVTSNKLVIPNNTLPKGVNIISVKDNNNSSIKKLVY